jgi:peroxiredoxin Q/BCP
MTNLKEGDVAPDFNALDENGEAITLNAYKGKRLILFFYPKDSTPTCTIESCNLRDNYKNLLALGIEVVGVSADTQRKHQNFIRRFNLPYRLISDTDKKVINDYGVWGPKKFMGRTFDGIHRITFVINEEGKIEKIFKKVKSKQHTDQILEALTIN